MRGIQPRLLKVVAEFAGLYIDGDPRRARAGQQAPQQLAADGGQQRVGQDGVDHAAAAFELGAALIAAAAELELPDARSALAEAPALHSMGTANA